MRTAPSPRSFCNSLQQRLRNPSEIGERVPTNGKGTVTNAEGGWGGWVQELLLDVPLPLHLVSARVQQKFLSFPFQNALRDGPLEALPPLAASCGEVFQWLQTDAPTLCGLL
jgi:hypothetical protein